MSNTINTMEEAIAYLQPIADSATAMPNYSKALMIAIGAMERVPVLDERLKHLEAELKDERYRHDRYADYSVERDRMIDQLKEDLRNSWRNDPCEYCKHTYETVPCAGDRVEDVVPCWECKRTECTCHACRERDKWEWRGVQEEQ